MRDTEVDYKDDDYKTSCDNILKELKDYTPLFSFGIFSFSLSQGHLKNRAKNIGLLEFEAFYKSGVPKNQSYMDLYKRLHDILFAPFANRDIAQDRAGHHTRYLSVLKSFDLTFAVGSTMFMSYTSKREEIKASMLYDEACRKK